jgi:hypothetical protein
MHAVTSRAAVSVIAIVAFAGSGVAAPQQPELPGSTEQRAISDQKSTPALVIPLDPSWAAPARRRLSVPMLVPPDRSGEMLKVRLPAGDLASRATQAISNGQYRRAVRKAHDDVLRALRELQIQTVMPPR